MSLRAQRRNLQFYYKEALISSTGEIYIKKYKGSTAPKASVRNNIYRVRSIPIYYRYAAVRSATPHYRRFAPFHSAKVARARFT